jgi:triosephosphate isomerase
MLLDAGATLTIAGHSERRDAQREASDEVKDKATAALQCGLDVILCVGEKLEVRDAGQATSFVVEQLDASLPDNLDGTVELAIAYEPVWAIGTGRTPTAAEIGDMHSTLRQRLVGRYGDQGAGIRILYGGSVKGSNAAEIFAVPEVDGALVGGASLKLGDFLPIVVAAASVG